MTYNIQAKGTWKKDLRLYVHVPFCVKKCAYCDFLSAPAGEDTINTYFEALYKEIRSFQGMAEDYLVSSVYIGGGTPSAVDSEKIVRTLDELKNVFRFKRNMPSDEDVLSLPLPEITIEINPGTVTAKGISKNKLMDYKNAGINRLSFGLQSTHEKELRLLGRIHTYEQFEENYYLARELGFNNINIDLMSALPGQTMKSWEENLIKTASLKPEHISAYSLIIEEGTPFYDQYGPEGSERNKLPSEEIDISMYMRTKEILLSFGYERYEISNYARKGFECRHNLAYWEPIDYLGFGLGAASLVDNTRFHNTFDLNEYIGKICDKSELGSISETIFSHPSESSNDSLNQTIKDSCSQSIYNSSCHKNNKSNGLLRDCFDIRKDIEILSIRQQMEEFMFLGLRKTKGISIQNFYERFGVLIDDIYGKILEALKNQGFIGRDNDRIWLTDYGINISNRVLAEFLLD